ncbi:acriflavin resistance protein [Candidatus Vecturithrix granuli]|uniref:Acriflavin resistance protein n=1 Tax=Vecturithrix granuli TaxID=1499967 RepID=A0A081BVV4_VECG1|nr:acriflavin resistance protein [Candidatus Vecturithrix granuli]
MKSLFKFFTERHLLANALTIMILLLGSYSLMTMNREEFPNADTGVVTISTTYSGASPEDVELEVTNKLEDKLKSITGIKTISSTSAENSSRIEIEIDEDEDQDEVYDEIVETVNGVDDLPHDADTPRITKMNPKMKSILTIGFSSGRLSYRELRDYVHDFEKKLLRIDGVAEVNLSGYLDREVRIEVSPDKLMKYGVSLNQLAEVISARNIRSSGGSIDTPIDQKNVITLAKFTDPEEVGDVIIKSYSSGAEVRVKDVATICDGFEESETIQRINGKPAISASVTKSTSADILRTSDAIKAMIAEEQATLPADTIEFMITRDDSTGVRDKFEIVKSNGAVGLILVFIILAIFLNIRTSFWVAMGIPVSLMGTLILLPFFDVELDSLTMAAMVLVIGIIVDDAIVISENIFQRREKGESPLEAAVNGVHEVALPVFSTVATTVLAFIPMFFITGMMGKFLYVVPLTVIIALTVSMLEAYLILPAHLMSSLINTKQQKAGRDWFRPIRQGFERLVSKMLSLRYVWLFLAVAILAGSIIHATGSMKFVLMDRGSNVESLDMTLEMPLGTALETTSSKMEEIEAILSTFPGTEISAYTTTIGSGGWRSVSSGHLATMTMYLPPASELARPVNEIVEDLRQQIDAISGPQEVTIGMSLKGPPTGNAVEILVKGGDKSTRNAAVTDIMAFLKTVNGVSDLERDDKSGKDEIIIQPKYSLLARYGLTVSDLAQTVRTTYEGQEATTTRYGDEDVSFSVILQPEYRKNLDYLKTLKISNDQGELINLEEVADFTMQPGVYAFYHEDADPTVTITGEIDENVTTSIEAMTAVKQEFDFEKMRQYSGIQLDVGGEAADSRQAIQDLLMSFGLAAIGIYFLLMLQFNSLTQPFIVLITIPFGVAGVILVMALHGMTQASFFAGIGVIGLAGVVVNDAIVMVDHLNVLIRRKDENMVALIAEGVADRLRPVILTTVTTVFGLLPLTYGIGGEDTMMGPMAMALGYGLLFATPITLILLPCLYMIRIDFQNVVGKVKQILTLRKPSIATLPQPKEASAV